MEEIFFKLWHAFDRRDFNEVTEVLNAGIDPDTLRSTLWILISRGDQEMFALYLEHGVNIDMIKDRIFDDIMSLDGNSIKMLVQLGLRRDMRNKLDYKLIHYDIRFCAEHGSDGFLRNSDIPDYQVDKNDEARDKFLSRMAEYHRLGYNFNDRDNDDGYSPLIYAIVNNAPQICITTLLRYGALADLPELDGDDETISAGKTALHYVSQYEKKREIRNLTESALTIAKEATFYPDVRNDYGETPLSHSRVEEVSRTWLEYGANPLMTGTQIRRLPYIGFMPHDFMWTPWTPPWTIEPSREIFVSNLSDQIIDALLQGDWNKTEALIEEGVPLNALSKDGVPLYEAMYQGDLGIVERLIDKGADFNFLPEELIELAPHLSPEMIDAAIRKGAQFAARDRLGFTVLHKEIQFAAQAILDQRPFSTEAFKARLELYRVAGSDINDRRNVEFSPPIAQLFVHREKFWGRLDPILEYLGIVLDQGAVLDLPYKEKGQTLLHDLIIDCGRQPQIVKLMDFIWKHSPFHLFMLGNNSEPLLHTVLRRGSVACLQFWLDKIIKKDDPKTLAGGAGYQEYAGFGNVYLNQGDLRNMTALAVLVEMSRHCTTPEALNEVLEKMRLTLAYGADPDKKYGNNETASIKDHVLSASKGLFPEEVVALFSKI